MSEYCMECICNQCEKARIQDRKCGNCIRCFGSGAYQTEYCKKYSPCALFLNEKVKKGDVKK